MNHNYMEKLVDKMLKKLIEEDRGEPKMFKCTCTTCIDSMRAITLNNLKPCYTTSVKGLVYVTFENNNPVRQEQILKQLLRAVEIVQANPKH